jgi:predicted TIM-barrel fold metal-dependent hydrolase
VIDCDIHPMPRSDEALDPYLSKAWRDHLRMFGVAMRQGFQRGFAYPKAQPTGSFRVDAVPDTGGLAGSDLGFMQQQHLDPHGIAAGILLPLMHGQASVTPGFGAAYCTAVNMWQIAEWLDRDPRLKGSVVVPYEDGEACAAEIERLADDARFVQVLLLNGSQQAYGHRRYWPIYAAAQQAGMPVAIHVNYGFSPHPLTASGWPSYYIEEMANYAQAQQSIVASLILEGVFEAFPRLRVVMVEGGYGWARPLAWRLDKVWRRLRADTPHLRRPPSEYLRDHVWFTTQPMEEPERRSHLSDVFDWTGWDRLMFSSDYPHWDSDDVRFVLPPGVTAEQRSAILFENARAFYGLDRPAPTLPDSDGDHDEQL